MLKKLLLVTAISIGSFSSIAQTTISQTNGAAPTTSTIFCPIAGSSANTYAGINATSYYRAYTMTAATKIVSVKIGNVVNLATGVTTFPITVKLYKSNGAFPASAASGLTQLASVSKNLNKSTADSSGNLVPSVETVDLTTPVAVASGDLIIVEVSHAQVNGGLFFMGAVASTASGTSGYIKAPSCSIQNVTDISTVTVGTPPTAANGKIVLDLVENNAASSEEFFNSNFAVYPNPTTDILNIESKNGLVSNEIFISDLSGKVLKSVSNANSINVSDLAVGTYFINISTNEGQATSKFLKK